METKVTTFVPAGRGVPALMIRDHGAWEQQVAAENRAQVDEEIKAAVAEIARGDLERRYSRPATQAELADGMRANRALYDEAQEAPGRVMRQLDATEALIRGMRATEPLPPGPDQARRDADNEYSFGLAETMRRLRG